MSAATQALGSRHQAPPNLREANGPAPESLPRLARSLTSLDLGQPALALLGGYSAGLMHRLPNRAMPAIETLFGGTRP